MNNFTESSFTSLHNLSKEQGVYEQLRHAITSGELRAGQRLICAQIGEQFGVSSMPVRNALMRLEAEGLVTRIPHREFVVRPYSSKDMRELYAVRAVLDSYAARLCAERATPWLLESLRGIMDRAESAMVAGDMETLRSINREFHSTLVECSGNRQLQEISQMLQGKAPSYHHLYYALPGMAKKALDDHRQIVAALVEGGADVVEALVRQDMENTGDILVGLVEQQEVSRRSSGQEGKGQEAGLSTVSTGTLIQNQG